MSSQLRVLAGRYKNINLRVPDGLNTRPTTSRVAENLFNVLQHYHFADQSSFSFEGKKILDLCAGSGRLGIEALSRGAARAIFVETDAAARGVIRENVDKLHLNGVTRIFSRDVTNLGAMPSQAKGPFDLIFCDAPYRKGIPEKALYHAYHNGWIASCAMIVVETEKECDILSLPFAVLQTHKEYGNTRLHFLERLE